MTTKPTTPRGTFRPQATMSATAQLMRANGLLNNRDELLLYGIIGDWWEGMDAFSIAQELESISGDTIVVRIHSRGGNIVEGLAMYNALRQAAKPVHIYIDGVCASMATVIAMAASPGHLYTPDNALWMIHKPWAEASGNADDLRQFADNLDVLEQSLVAAYTATGRVTEAHITEILSTGKDYYFTGAEAVEQGFADQQTPSIEAAASIDLSTLNQPQGQHKALFDFYAVNAATPPQNREDRTMKRKLKKLMAALTQQGVAAADINKALATAMNVAVAEVDALLADAGNPTDAQLQAGLDALALLEAEPQNPEPQAAARGPQPSAAPQPMTAQAAIAIERRRIADINALASRHGLPDDARDQLVTSGATLEDARAAALDHLAQQDSSRQPRPGVRLIDTSGPAFREGIACAMLNRMQPGRYQLEEGAREFRGMNLLTMAAECLERAGVSTRGLSANELAARALHTTSDFPNVVADVANKVLLAAYQAQPRTFLPIANRATLTNFKLKHAIEIGGGSDLKEVSEAGEYEHGTVSESNRSYKLSTFGRIFALSRQLMINDDIGALNQFLSNIGSLASRKESQVVWGLVKAGAIFSQNNKNVVTAGGAVSDTQLNNMRKTLRQMKGLDGEPINITGRYLVVNSERETEAQKALAAVLAVETSEVNVFQNSLSLIVEPLLDDVSNNPWYVWADPALVPTLEYAYLEGEEGPYIETRNGFEVDGIQIKVRHDFGAGWTSHRGCVRNAGTGG